MMCYSLSESVKYTAKHNDLVSKNSDSFRKIPNTLLLSEPYTRSAYISNLIEFPLLQMLYERPIPNEIKDIKKPILISSSYLQIGIQIGHFQAGNYGTTDIKDMIKSGLSLKDANNLINMKLLYTGGGEFKNLTSTVDLIMLYNKEYTEIRDGVYMQKINNTYNIKYKDTSFDISSSKHKQGTYLKPTTQKRIDRSDYFSVIHIGEGNGWSADTLPTSSIVNFNKKLYLIDAPLNIDKTLKSLNISINDLEGIIHTHIHDDHFIGIFALLNTNKKMKYIATPLVRETLIRKLSCISNVDVLSLFFDVVDLTLDTWNNIDGLEVKPFLSAHTVDTTCMFFRVKDIFAEKKDIYKTYSYLMDIASYSFLDKMLQQDNIDNDFVEKIRSYYEAPADLKKVDIGEGLIHGYCTDFENDASSKIRYSHIRDVSKLPQSVQDNVASFGEVDVLIEGEEDYCLQNYKDKIKRLFTFCDDETINNILKTSQILKPKDIIYNIADEINNLYMIIDGSVEVCSENRSFEISGNSCIAKKKYRNKEKATCIYIATTYVQIVTIPREVFAKKYCDTHINLYEDFLITNYKYGKYLDDKTSFDMASSIKEVKLSKGQKLDNSFFETYSYIVKMGNLEIKSTGIIVDTAFGGDILACPSFFKESVFMYFDILVKEDTILYALEKDYLKQYPLYNADIFHKCILYNEKIADYITSNNIFIKVEDFANHHTYKYEFSFFVHVFNVLYFVVQTYPQDKKMIFFYTNILYEILLAKNIQDKINIDILSLQTQDTKSIIALLKQLKAMLFK